MAEMFATPKEVSTRWILITNHVGIHDPGQQIVTKCTHSYNQMEAITQLKC